MRSAKVGSRVKPARRTNREQHGEQRHTGGSFCTRGVIYSAGSFTMSRKPKINVAALFTAKQDVITLSVHNLGAFQPTEPNTTFLQNDFEPFREKVQKIRARERKRERVEALLEIWSLKIISVSLLLLKLLRYLTTIFSAWVLLLLNSKSITSC